MQLQLSLTKLERRRIMLKHKTFGATLRLHPNDDSMLIKFTSSMFTAL